MGENVRTFVLDGELIGGAEVISPSGRCWQGATKRRRSRCAYGALLFFHSYACGHFEVVVGTTV
jgi:hypothetical protein